VALCGRVFCGMVWKCEALWTVVKFGPVKYCYVSQAEEFQGPVRKGMVMYRSVQSGLARLSAVGQAEAFRGGAENG
jgi:hypothetical protein